jgi:hypothetical protein
MAESFHGHNAPEHPVERAGLRRNVGSEGMPARVLDAVDIRHTSGRYSTGWIEFALENVVIFLH